MYLLKLPKERLQDYRTHTVVMEGLSRYLLDNSSKFSGIISDYEINLLTRFNKVQWSMYDIILGTYEIMGINKGRNFLLVISMILVFMSFITSDNRILLMISSIAAVLSSAHSIYLSLLHRRFTRELSSKIEKFKEDVVDDPDRDKMIEESVNIISDKIYAISRENPMMIAELASDVDYKDDLSATKRLSVILKLLKDKIDENSTSNSAM